MSQSGRDRLGAATDACDAQRRSTLCMFGGGGETLNSATNSASQVGNSLFAP
jgi:hypothetical protein